MPQPESPWMPGPKDIPWTFAFVNPQGDRHLAFNDEEGRFYRLWQHQPPQPLHAGEAILLRPSDIDQIIKHAMVWIMAHPKHPASYTLGDEIADGARAVVVHFAEQAGAR